MLRTLIWALLALLASAALRAEILVRDDTGQTLRLAHTARRIVSLAPHITENLYAAGAGGRLIATVDASDYPAAAKALPRVGSNGMVDLEAIVALRPDLVIAWQTGTSLAHLDKLRAMGLVIYLSEPKRIDDVAGEIERFGQLAGSEPTALLAANRFRQRLAKLRSDYAERPRVRTFYQIWKQPLMTVGGGQIIADAIRLCGGENVFGQLTLLAPTVTVEAVLAQDPEAIVASGMDAARPEWLDDWKIWRKMTAVSRGNLFFVPPELIQRHTLRLLDGAEMLCRHLQTARTHRPVPVNQPPKGSP